MVWYPDYNYILGSKSPRRAEILQQLGLPFSVVAIEGEEDYPPSLHRNEIALHIAREKAVALRDKLSENDLLITADTIVWVDGDLLAKPENEGHALSMLKRLSGTTHEVITGVCLTTLEREKCFFALTEVVFREVSEAEMDFYIRTYQPFDKAGAYGIQEWIGLAFIERINGSYFNVVGMPADLLYYEIRTFDNLKNQDMLKNR